MFLTDRFNDLFHEFYSRDDIYTPIALIKIVQIIYWVNGYFHSCAGIDNSAGDRILPTEACLF
jgi:hypothetical protein